MSKLITHVRNAIANLLVGVLWVLLLAVLLLIFIPQQYQDLAINKALDVFGYPALETEVSVTTVGEFQEEPKIIVGHQEIRDSITRVKKEMFCPEATRVLHIVVEVSYVYEVFTGQTDYLFVLDTLYEHNYPSTKPGRCSYETQPFNAMQIAAIQDSIMQRINLDPELNPEEVRNKAEGYLRREYAKWKLSLP